MVYIDKLSLAASYAGITERLAKISHNKLMPRMMGPFGIVSV